MAAAEAACAAEAGRPEQGTEPSTPPRQAAARPAAGDDDGFGRRLPSMRAVPGLAAAEETCEPARRPDVGLGTVAFPAAAVRRIVRGSAPATRFSSEAIAAVHRVAQAFVCYATDRSIHELQGNLAPAMSTAQKKKAMASGGKAGAATRKTLGIDHVLKVLSKDIPPVATKICNLFPELVPADFRPQDVRLLEQLHEQKRVAANAALLLEGAPDCSEGDFGFAPGAEAPPAGGEGTASKRPAEAAGEAGEEGGEPPKKRPATASLSSMFNRQKASAAEA